MNISQLAEVLAPKFSSAEGTTTLRLDALGDARYPNAFDDINAAIRGAMPGTPPALVLTNVQPSAPTPDPNNWITVRGTFSLYNDHPLSATIVFYLVNSAADGTPECTVSLDAGTTNTFSSIFPQLVDTTVDTLMFNQPRFVLSSHTQDGTGQFPGAQKGFNFSGQVLTSSAVFTNIGWLFTGTPTMSMTGLITNVIAATTVGATAVPVMTLCTSPEAASISLSAATFQLWISLATGEEHAFDDPDETAVEAIADVLLCAEFAIRSGNKTIRVPLQLSLDSSNRGLLALSIDLNALLTDDNTIPEIALDGLSDLNGLTGGTSLNTLIPPQFGLSSATLAIQSLTIVVNPSRHTLTNLSFGIGVKNLSLTLVPSLITLTEIGLIFSINSPLTPRLDNIFAQITGTFAIAEEADIQMSVALPSLIVQGWLREGDMLSARGLLEHFLGQDVPVPNLIVSDFQLLADPRYGTYDLSTVVEADYEVDPDSDAAWTINLGIADVIKFESLLFQISRTPTDTSVLFQSGVRFLDVPFSLVAQRPPGRNWLFSGEMLGDLSIGSLAARVLPADWAAAIPVEIQAITVSELRVAFDTTANTYAFAATVTWPLQLGSRRFVLSASLTLATQRAKPSDPPQYSGAIKGSFTYNNLVLSVGYTFGPANRSLYFQFNQLIVEYLTATRQPPLKPTQQLLIRFGDLTVGDILQFIVNLAAPGRQITLPAPWNALLAINLRNLALVVDFVESSIGIRYNANVNLGFIEIAAFEIVYTRQYGKSKVLIRTTGKFLDQEYKDGNALQWDALNQPPPAVPGTGIELIDIQYLGLGQHIALLNAPSNMTAIIDKLQTAIVPVDNAGQNPLAHSRDLAFSSSSAWLVGARIVIMSTFTISVIFNDPQLYGLQVKVNGPKGGVFQGLMFEVLYRKIDETTGVFHVDLMLPAAIRQLEFGQVSVTLPRVTIDLYTNGNFRLNFGFPSNPRDFSGCFGVQVFPFIGMGGFYLAKLNGNTSSMVPQISNGSFSPVIEFGLALAIGVGKTINKGALSAGLSLTVQGVLQGVLAWFNPSVSSARSDIYFWVQGTISIVGRIFGSVDFGPISANISVTAYASASLVIEAYRPIVIALSAGVSAQASVKIWFVRVHFSYSTTISESFTIGSTQQTPWRVIPGSPPPTRPRFAARSLAEARAISALVTLPNELNLTMETALDEPKTTIRLTLVPAFSKGLADGMLSANGQTVPPSGTPLVTCSLLLFVENAIDFDALTPEQVATFDAANAQKPFNLLLGKLLRWVIGKAANQSTNVTSVDLDNIVAQMTQTSFLNANFTYEQLAQFCADNFIFEIRPRAGDDANMSGTFFPMIPGLALGDGQGLHVAFDSYTPTNQAGPDGSTYAEKLNLFLRFLNAEYANSAEDTPALQSATVSTVADPSMARYLFKSYFTMLTRTIAQAAADLMRSYRYELRDTATLTLSQIAASFPAGALPYTAVQGDTLAYLERRFYVSQADLLAVNPGLTDPPTAGTEITIPLRVTPLSILRANQTADVLNSDGGTLPIDGVTYQVRANDTLTTIATTLRSTVKDLVARNGRKTGIFRMGATIALGSVTYTTRSNDTPESIRAYFGVTSADLTPPNPTSGQIVTIANVRHTVSNRDADRLAVGVAWVFSYVVAANDTLDSLIAHYFPEAADSTLKAEVVTTIRSWNAALDLPDAGPLQAGLVLHIPYTPTFEHLAIYYLGLTLPALLADDSLASATLLQSANTTNTSLLALLAVLDSPTISYAIQPGDTFDRIAQQFGLTLEQLVRSPALLAQPNIFRAAPQGEQPYTLTLPQLPAIAIDRLLDALGTSGAFNTAAAMVSRFLLHGLQLPDPTTFSTLPLATLLDPANLAGIGTFPLYVLTGQEFIAPPATSTAYTLSLSNPAGLSWLSFPHGSTLTLNANELAQIATLDQAQFAPQQLEFGVLPPYTNVPLRFSLQQHQHWQTAVLPSGTCLSTLSQRAVQPCLWTIPDIMRATVAEAADGTLLYQVMLDSRQADQPGGEVKPAECAFWATVVTFTIQRLDDDPAAQSGLRTTYLVKGADEIGKPMLLDLFTYLDSSAGQQDSATLYLLYGAPQAEDGLLSDDLNRAATFLLKTNLSTLSHNEPQPFRARALSRELLTIDPVAPGLYNASLDPASSKDFIKLLWECSVVRSGGYYLDYQSGAVDQPSLPQHLFDSGGNATLTLLVVLGSQAMGGLRPLRRFNNRAVLGLHIDGQNVFAQPPTYTVQANDTLVTIAGASTMIPNVSPVSIAVANQHLVNLLDPAASLIVNGAAYQIQAGDTLASIAARAQGSVEAIAGVVENQNRSIFRRDALLLYNDRQSRVQAVTRPGNVGFQLTRRNPATSGNDDPTNVENLFSLLTYRILPNNRFLASNAAVPLSPSVGSQDRSNGITAAPNDPARWQYQQFLSPLYFLSPAVSTVLSRSAALPAVPSNPYADIGPDAALNLQLAFRDIYGNTTQQGTYRLDTIPLRFYDPLIGIGSWPNVTNSFDVAGSDPNPLLNIYSDLKTESYLPTPGTDYATTSAAARADVEQFKQIYYQITQLYQPLSLTTTLGQLATDEPGATVSWQLGLALTTFVASAYQFLSAVNGSALVRAQVAAGERFSDVAARYRVAIAALAAANRDLPLGAIFPTTGSGALVLNVPQYFSFQSGNSIWTIIGSDASRLAALATNNADQPLRLNTVIVAPARSYNGPDLRSQTLMQIATRSRTTIAEIAERNAQQPLRLGATLMVDGLALTVDGATNTLTTLAAAFQVALRTRDNSQHIVTPVDVALSNPLVVGVFDRGAQLSFARYVVDEGDTLTTIARTTGAADPVGLLSLNYSAGDPARNTPDLYEQGTALWVQNLTYQPRPAETFASVAALFGLPLETLWNHNAGAQLSASHDALLVPFHVTAPASGYAAYVATATDTLTTVAGNAGLPLADLVALNRDVHGVLKLQPFSLNERQATPDQSSTLDSIAQQLGLDLNSFVEQAKDLPLIRAGAMLLTTAITVRTGGETLAALATRLNCSTAQLAQANSAVCDLFDTSTPQQEISFPNHAPIMVGEHDTFATLAAAFGDPLVTVATLAAQNPALKLRSAAALLPPVRAVRYTAHVTPAYPTPIFRVEVMLTQARDPRYVAADLQDSPVARVQTAFVARPLADRSDEARLGLEQFARAFETAFKNLKLAKGADRDPRSSTASAGNTERRALWAVNFAQGKPSGFQFNAQNTPRFYGVKPLYAMPWSTGDQTIAVPSYTHVGGLDSTATTERQYHNVDLDDWVKQLLSALDLFLSPRYALPLYRLDAIRPLTLMAVDAKQKVAQGLRSQLDYLIVSPDQPAGYLTAAQEALYEQALVTLASAYDTDLIVQYPFAVSSPETNGDTAPRLSGRPVADQYITGHASGDGASVPETLATVAQAFGVSKGYAALVLQQVRDLLNPGITVQYRGVDFPIISSSVTLAEIAAYYEIDVVTLADGLAVKDQAALFTADVAINASRIVIPVPANATFSDLADALDSTVNSVVLANWDAAGLFADGSPIRLSGKTTTAAQSDPLSAIAGRLGLSREDLADALWAADQGLSSTGDNSYTLRQGALLHGMQLLPQYSFTTGKLPLVDGTALATFLFNAKDDSAQRSIFLNLDYAVNEMEYAIAEQPIEGFRESSWLTFIIPITSSTLTGSSTRIGQTEVPIPVRSFPAAPVLSGQEWLPVAGDPDNKRWSYKLEFDDHQVIPQDSTFLHVGFNVADDAVFANHMNPPQPPRVLVAALARFVTLYADIQQDLMLIFAPQTPETIATIQRAASAFVTLVAAVADAWSRLAPPPLGDGHMGHTEIHEYRLDFLKNDARDTSYAYLRLLAGEEHARERLWPRITDDDSGSDLALVTQSPRQTVYRYPHAVDDPADLTLRFDTLLALDGQPADALDVIRQQNGWSGACVQRNKLLIYGHATNEAFVYSSPMSLFSNKVTPLLTQSDFRPLNGDVAGTPGDALSLSAALGAFFQNLFTPTPAAHMGITAINISVVVRYGYPLVATPGALSSADLAQLLNSTATSGSQLILTFVPQLLYPEYAFKITAADGGPDWQDTGTTFVGRLAAAVQQIGQSSGIAPETGIYVFDIDAYATLQAGSSLPIIERHNLYYSYLLFTPAALDAGEVGTPYNGQVTAGGGKAPYRYSVQSGKLPPGLTLDADTGRLSGKPMEAGSYSFTVHAADSNGQPRVGSQTYQVPVRLMITTDTLPDGVRGTAYSTQIQVLGSTEAVGFSLLDGALPPGLALDGAGVIKGTPTQAGSYSFVIGASETTSPDRSLTRASRRYTLTISMPTLEQMAAQLWSQDVPLAQAGAQLRQAFPSATSPEMAHALVDAYRVQRSAAPTLTVALKAAGFDFLTTSDGLQAVFPELDLEEVRVALTAAFVS